MKHWICQQGESAHFGHQAGPTIITEALWVLSLRIEGYMEKKTDQIILHNRCFPALFDHIYMDPLHVGGLFG